MTVPNKKNESLISLQLLQVLRDCAVTTRMGLIDKGNPRKLGQLAAFQFVESKNGGYVVTTLGKEYLSSHKRDIMKL